MADRRDMRHLTTPAGQDDGRTAMGRAGDNLPPRFYDPGRGREEPPEVTAARQRHRAISEQIEAARAALYAGTRADGEAAPDAAPGYEWYRELADEPPLSPAGGAT